MQTFNGSTSKYIIDFSGTKLAGISDFPLTMAGWFNTNSTNDQEVMTLYMNAGTSNIEVRLRNPGDTDLIALIQTTGGTSVPTSASSYSTSTLYHACLVVTTTGSTIYLDGVAGTPVAGTNTFDAFDRLSIGYEGENSRYPFNGDLGEIAIWNEEFTADEVKALADGAAPLRMRADKLVYYVPMITDNQFDRMSGLTGSTTAIAKAATHPPIFYSNPIHIIDIAAGGGGPTYVNMASAESTTTTETATLSQYTNLLSSESVTNTETATLSQYTNLLSSESVTTTETATLSQYTNLASTEVTTVTETGSLQTDSSVNLASAESVTVTETGLLSAYIGIESSESVTTTDTGLLSAYIGLGATESVTVTEAGTLSIEGEVVVAPAIDYINITEYSPVKVALSEYNTATITIEG